MESVLEGHENKGDFLKHLSLDTPTDEPAQDNSNQQPESVENVLAQDTRQPGEKKPETIAKMKEACEEIEFWLKTVPTIKEAAKKATEKIYGSGNEKRWERLTRQRNRYLTHLELTHLKRQNGKN